MCGHVEIGKQKDVKIIKSDGGSYSTKNNGEGNLGSMLQVVSDEMPVNVQQE